MNNRCISREQELYRLLWEIFAPFGRGLDIDKQTALDGLIDVAAKRLAEKEESAE